MKWRTSIAFILAMGMALVITAAVIAQGPDPLTLNMYAREPVTLDPSTAARGASAVVIEDLFLGLVDVDDETAEINPELATSWMISPDGTVYTFTLRTGVTWSDGNPVTAGDVRYGILRTLDPATNADFALMLDVIENAEGYRTGAIADANQVGVEALDNTHLRITMERPASHVLSILAMWVARPMPQWTIQAWGDNWTDPAHIVTNGAYRLTEWTAGDHILLDRNPTYYGVANAQIERVRMWFVDEDTAWTMYQNGQLETTSVPGSATLDPILGQETHLAFNGCTEFYAFNSTRAPFTDPLVRKAFIAATNRQGLVNDNLGGIAQTALTFTPPLVLGHVDGQSAGVGIPHNPLQAQQWLAQAGYPNGQGLPPITLWYNTDSTHQANAEHIRQNWIDNLNVTVTLQHKPWNEYLQDEENGLFQVWRTRWCADYPDADGFLRIVFRSDSSQNHTGWGDTAFDTLVDQAAQEQNQANRKDLLRQAEEILVETDAVILPLYYWASALATKPYLERTYSVVASPDIDTWRITRVSTIVGTDGGTLTSLDGNTNIQIPNGAITDTAVVTYTPATAPPPGGGMTGIGHAFDITAVYSETGQSAQITPGHTVTITVEYTDDDVSAAIEDTLGLRWWNASGNIWSQQGIATTVNVADNLVTAQTSHFSLFAVLGEAKPGTYLPVVLRYGLHNGSSFSNGQVK